MTEQARSAAPAHSATEGAGTVERTGTVEPFSAKRRPERPALASPYAPPVVVKVPPPFSVRLSLLLWVLSFTVGAFAAVYLFIIRKDLLPLIADVAEGVTSGRSAATYESAADIVFWVFFGSAVTVLAAQITLLVSFMGRRGNVRWWQLATLVVLALLVLLSPEWVALGAEGAVLQPLLTAQAALVLLALLAGTLPRAIAWSARHVDVRRGPQGASGGDL